MINQSKSTGIGYVLCFSLVGFDEHRFYFDKIGSTIGLL